MQPREGHFGLHGPWLCCHLGSLSLLCLPARKGGRSTSLGVVRGERGCVGCGGEGAGTQGWLTGLGPKTVGS